jgi:hypothetical protein
MDCTTMGTSELEKPHTVWILGAGFSKGLGGPLIQDLLAHRELPVLESYFPTKSYGGAANDLFKARLFFNYGLERRYWDHAEQFLDLVESAAAEKGSDPSHARALLQSMLKDTVRYPQKQTIEQGSGLNRYVVERPGPSHEFGSIDDLAAACRRALAVDCSLFLRSAQLDSERWSPYKHWAQSLNGGHTVITFNYDQVPELLGADTKNLKVVDPMGAAGDIEDARRLDVAPVIKVHGSVTWRRGSSGVEVMARGDPGIGDPRTDVVIGVPGPAKRKLYRETLKPLRAAAVEALQTARKVIFLGYRFPPTDADARRDILSALVANETRTAVRIETVLGPRVSSDDSVRLRQLIHVALGTNLIDQVPLFAEDYLLRIAAT